jgi:hypothetical protein
MIKGLGSVETEVWNLEDLANGAEAMLILQELAKAGFKMPSAEMPGEGYATTVNRWLGEMVDKLKARWRSDLESGVEPAPFQNQSGKR